MSGENKRLMLGTMNFGSQVSEQETSHILDMAWNLNITHWDTASIYPSPISAQNYGKTESLLGQWIQANNLEQNIHITTKIPGPDSRLQWLSGLEKHNYDYAYSPAHLTQALQELQDRLQSQKIDQLLLHWPLRPLNILGQRNIVIEETQAETEEQRLSTLECLDNFKKKGYIENWGLSNESSWGIMNWLTLAQMNNLAKPTTLQNPWNLLNRNLEDQIAEVCYREGLNIQAYSPLAFGTLTGKYEAQPEQIKEDSRKNLWGKHFNRYHNQPNQVQATRAYLKLAQKHDLNPIELALGYLKGHGLAPKVILGVSSKEQLSQNVAFWNKRNLSESVLKKLQVIHHKFPNPCV